MKIFQNLKAYNAEKKACVLKKYLRTRQSILDFGCGDLLLDVVIKRNIRGVKITGIDVVDFGVRKRGIRFKQYNGKRIPYANNTFDVVIAWHVFHHTSDPESLFKECMRVAKKQVIFVEPVFRHIFELPGMTVMDWLFNVWKTKSIDLRYAFHSEWWWRHVIENVNGKLVFTTDVDLLPAWLPTGRSRIFVVRKSSP